MKKIWFVSHYSMPPNFEMRVKTQMYAHYLQKMGYKCIIFSASTIHNTSINLINDNSKYIECSYGDLHFVHIKVSNYSGNGIKRIINMKQFTARFYKVATNFELPDIVIADTNCISYKPIYLFCKKNNIRFYLDIRDLWPESIVEYYHLSKKNPIISWLYKKEEKMYIRATGIIFSMEGAYNYIIDRKLDKKIPRDKVFCINNGVDLESFEYNKENFQISDSDLDNDELTKIVYTGSIRKVNNLGLLIDAMKLIHDPAIKLLIWGAGNEIETLNKRILEEKITNVVIKGSVEKKYIPFILSKADVNILHNTETALTKYGLSLNKMFEYAAAGNPILVDFGKEYNPLLIYEAAMSTNSNTIESISQGITRVCSISDAEKNKMKANSKKCANDYDYKKLTLKLIKIFESD